jgi:hypothetical protein
MSDYHVHSKCGSVTLLTGVDLCRINEENFDRVTYEINDHDNSASGQKVESPANVKYATL